MHNFLFLLDFLFDLCLINSHHHATPNTNPCQPTISYQPPSPIPKYQYIISADFGAGIGLVILEVYNIPISMSTYLHQQTYLSQTFLPLTTYQPMSTYLPISTYINTPTYLCLLTNPCQPTISNQPTSTNP